MRRSWAGVRLYIVCRPIRSRSRHLLVVAVCSFFPCVKFYELAMQFLFIVYFRFRIKRPWVKRTQAAFIIASREARSVVRSHVSRLVNEISPRVASSSPSDAPKVQIQIYPSTSKTSKTTTIPQNEVDIYLPNADQLRDRIVARLINFVRMAFN